MVQEYTDPYDLVVVGAGDSGGSAFQPGVGLNQYAGGDVLRYWPFQSEESVSGRQ